MRPEIDGAGGLPGFMRDLHVQIFIAI